MIDQSLLSILVIHIIKSNHFSYFEVDSSSNLWFTLCRWNSFSSRILSPSSIIFTFVLSQITATMPRFDSLQDRPSPTPTEYSTFPYIQSITVNYCSINPPILLPLLIHPHWYPSSILSKGSLSYSE